MTINRLHTSARQSNRTHLPRLFCALVIALSAAPLNAAEISFPATVIYSEGPFASLFNYPDSVTISYTLDASVVDTNADPNAGVYLNATQALTISFPDLGLAAVFSGGNVQTFDNTVNPDDQIFIGGSFNDNGSTLGGEVIIGVELDFVGDTTMIDDDSLPLALPNDVTNANVWVMLATASGFTVVGLWPNPVMPTTSELISDLADLIISINLNSGIANSFDSKLSVVVGALDDSNQNNDGAALNAMYAFCSSVEAQRARKISDTDANQLIDAANQIIASIDEFASSCD